MDYQTFLLELDKLKWGVGASNTYHHDGNYCFFIIAAANGCKGLHSKIEGEVRYMNTMLDDFIEDIRKLARLKVVELT